MNIKHNHSLKNDILHNICSFHHFLSANNYAESRLNYEWGNAFKLPPA